MHRLLSVALALPAALALTGCREAPDEAPSSQPGTFTTPGEIRISTAPAGAPATAWMTGVVRGRVFADGGVPAAFVFAERGPHRSLLWQLDATYLPRLDVRDGRLAPRVFGMMTGETLRIVNADAAAHGLVFRGERTGRFVVQVPAAGRADQTFREDDVAVAITHTDRDDTTGWMFVLEHPFFATTDADGAFEIPELPPGDYTFVAWHETLGRAEFDVSVDVDVTTETDVVLPGPGAAALPVR